MTATQQGAPLDRTVLDTAAESQADITAEIEAIGVELRHRQRLLRRVPLAGVLRRHLAPSVVPSWGQPV